MAATHETLEKFKSAWLPAKLEINYSSKLLNEWSFIPDVQKKVKGRAATTYQYDIVPNTVSTLAYTTVQFSSNKSRP